MQERDERQKGDEVMSLLDTFGNYLIDGDKGRRAVFEAAMIKRIESGEGYKMSDLLYEVCNLEANLEEAMNRLDKLEARITKKSPKKRDN